MGNGIPCSRNPPKHNSLFRSEEMTLCQLFLQSESAYSVIAELGELGLVQFKDLNPEMSAFQRRFVNEVRVCDEMDRILRFVEGEIEKEKIKVTELSQLPEAPQAKQIRELHMELEKLEGDLREINANRQQLKSNFLELKELQVVLNASHHFLEETSIGSAPEVSFANGKDMGQDIEMGERPTESTSMRLNFLTGTIPLKRIIGFERMLWFACRGNIYLRYTEIQEEFEEPKTGEPVRKAVFCLFFQGEQLKIRAKKICEGFKSNLYTLPKTVAERHEMSQGLAQRIADIHMVLEKTDDHRRRLLVNASHDIRTLSVKVLKTKAIYHTLNMFNMDVTQKCHIAECWCPSRDLERINMAITDGTRKSNSDVPSVLNRLRANEVIPTFNRVNTFTSAFQSIVDAYGVARYQEVNPALFTVITFPFIFAVMFGDCAHGIIMFCFALWMVVKEREFKNQRGASEIWGTIFGGRYIILLMGLFSIYTGWIYNDFFSKSVNIFGSGWAYPNPQLDDVDNLRVNLQLTAEFIQLDPTNRSYSLQHVHPFGMDPVWMIATNKITFTNSYKMKMSIVLGVTQMLFGLCICLINMCFFRNWVGIFMEFIPEMIFILSIFGYMIVLIIAKWVTLFAQNTSCAPSILVGFINMFLFSEDKTSHDCDTLKIMFANPEQQKLTQTILVILAVICMPWLLLGKPICILIKRALQKKRHYAHTRQRDNQTDGLVEQNGNHEEASAEGQAHSGGSHEDHESFGEIFVHQCIHTIEYCLGCVSNTASYLRLWALSLAHAQLSEVLWNMVLKIGLSSNDNFTGAPIIIILFPPFAVLTVAVLLLMEGLSAFLHALRLHWVEFNSKFYAGDGIKFMPFNFKDVLSPTTSD